MGKAGLNHACDDVSVCPSLRVSGSRASHGSGSVACDVTADGLVSISTDANWVITAAIIITPCSTGPWTLHTFPCLIFCLPITQYPTASTAAFLICAVVPEEDMADLHTAVCNGDVQRMLQLIGLGTDLNIKEYM